MKKLVYILIAFVSFNVAASDGDEESVITTSALSLESVPYSAPRNIAPSRKGFLQDADIAIGTILKSHHFDDDYDFNETHNGAYLRVERWTVGTYTNSFDAQSTFVTYNPKIYSGRSLAINLVAGVANGYGGSAYARGDYLPLLGVGAQWMHLTAVMQYGVVALGIELPMN